MLAKIWKKLLLAICIIACLYNIMHKLVSRTSLEIQLRSVENRSSIIDLENNTNKEKKSEPINTTNESNNNITEKSVYNTTIKNEIITEDAEQEDDKNDSIVVIY